MMNGSLNMQDESTIPPTAEMRPPERVMRLTHIGSLHATRISFMRSLIRRMAAEGWQIRRARFDLDAGGYGHAVYEILIDGRIYSFVAFADELSMEERTDRVIAERWDYTFALHDGPVSDADLARLRANVPRQEAGRCSTAEFVLARGNKSLRLFETVVASLAGGRQPDLQAIAEVGYLMRTTAVYGNGKFGMADYHHVWKTSPFKRPFEAQMLVVYLARLLSLDVAEHVASCRAPEGAVKLSPAIRRFFGVGNSTGLGMAPFLINHPKLLHAWMHAYETALARVRAVRQAGTHERVRFRQLLARAVRHAGEWQTADDIQSMRIGRLQAELADLQSRIARDEKAVLPDISPWAALMTDLEGRPTGAETVELVNSLVLELYPGLVDDLEDHMWASPNYDTRPEMPLDDLKRAIEEHYDWALAVDYQRAEDEYYFWYRSARKLEPRLGERAREPGAEREMLIGIGREVRRLHDRLAGLPEQELGRSTARFLLSHPDCRGAVRRVQSMLDHPYGEVRDNLLGAETRPIDLLRCKLAFFGASKFDPKSDLWTRITMFQGAPMPDELSEPDADDWSFPCMPEGE